MNKWQTAREAIRKSSKSSTIYIGCDSIRKKKSGQWFARYSTVVVIHKDSMHGCNIFYDDVTKRDFSNYKDLTPRLMSEVQFALEAYEHIKDVLDGRELKIHLDVNPDPKHRSNIVTAQALGWVRGMGLEAEIKPDAWAATHAADHCVRGKNGIAPISTSATN